MCSVSPLCVVYVGPPPFGSSWVKRYCTFVKEQKILHMVTFDHRSGGKIVSDRRRATHLFLYLFFKSQTQIGMHLACCSNHQPHFDSVFSFSGGNGVHHTQILRPENDRCVGPEVLLRPRHNRSVYYRFTLFICRCRLSLRYKLMSPAGQLDWSTMEKNVHSVHRAHRSVLLKALAPRTRCLLLRILAG